MTRKHVLSALILLAPVGAALVLWVILRPQNPLSESARVVALFTYVSHPVLDSVRDATKRELEQLADRNGTQVEFREYSADGNDARIPPLSRSLLQEGFDLAIPISTPVSKQLVFDAPDTAPIVYSFVTIPEVLGPARTTKNVTGVSDVVNYPGNVDLLVSWIPAARKIGMLYNPAEPNSVDAVHQVKPLLEKRGLSLLVVEVSGSSEVAKKAAALAPEIDAFYVGGDNTVVGAMKSLVEVASRFRKPVFASDSGSVANGAVAALSVDYAEIGRATAQVAGQVLFGGKAPRDIPPVSVSGNQVLYHPRSLDRFGLSVPAQYTTRARPISNP